MNNPLRDWLPRLLFWGSPCLAVTILVGIATADAHLANHSVPLELAEVLHYANGTLAFVGAAAGGMLARARFAYRIIASPAAGAFGLSAYVLLLFLTDAVIPWF